jgi:GNAT superfamily N-acetyltransferase
MGEIRIVDVTGQDAFTLVPPCADPSFDHRSCDYWEDAVAGSKARRESWLRPRAETPGPGSAPGGTPERDTRAIVNPFLEEASRREPAFNPFSIGSGARNRPDPFGGEAGSSDGPDPFEREVARERVDPFGSPDAPDLFAPIADNPFAPPPRRLDRPGPGSPRKLGLLTRGAGVFGSYARMLVVDGRAAAYCQFGPLSAYPRALQLRDLYPQLPASPLPAVITCIATTADARRQGHALALVRDVCDELARRGFAAVETYPEAATTPDATSTAFPSFWERAGFGMVVRDERYPVMRREL